MSKRNLSMMVLLLLLIPLVLGIQSAWGKYPTKNQVYLRLGGRRRK